MRSSIKLLTLLIATLCFSSPSFATSYRVDFSGSTPTAGETFSGYAILDYTVTDSDNLPSQGTYVGAVTQFELQVGDTEFELVDTAGSGDVVVFNNDLFYNDLFAIFATVQSTDGTSGSEPFILQLGDASSSIFSDTSLPTELNFGDFDASSSNI